MTLNTLAKMIMVGVLIAQTSGCSRNLEEFESSSKIRDLTDGDLCEQATVVLLNKDELRKYVNADNFRFDIRGSAQCLNEFERSLFSSEQLKKCQSGKGSACTKKVKGDIISVMRWTENRVELNTWS